LQLAFRSFRALEVSSKLNSAVMPLSSEKSQARARAYYARNQEQILAKAASYRRQNRERLAAEWKRYYQSKKAELYEKKKAYIAANPDKMRDWKRADYKRNRDAYLRRAAAHQRKSGSQIKRARRYSRARCLCCSEHATRGRQLIDQRSVKSSRHERHPQNRVASVKRRCHANR